MYFAFAAIYVALVIVFIVDVLRNPRLSSGARIGWILAVLILPVLSWITYGFIRMRQSRGLA
jgi:hypothetical protein